MDVRHGHLQETTEVAGMLPHVPPQINSENQMAGQSHEPGGPKQSTDHGHRGHDPQNTASLDRAYHTEG